MKALQYTVNVPRFVAAKTAAVLLGSRVFYRGPLASVRLAEVPDPGLPGEDWVVVRVFMCGFCGSDLNLILYRESPTGSPFTSFPCIIGHELCGEIVEKGRAVRDFNRGDYVTFAPPLGCAPRGISPECPSCREGMTGSCANLAEGNLSPGMFTGICSDIGGGFAPFMTAHKSQLFRLHEKIPPAAGAMVEPLSVALQAVMDNLPGRGDRVLVIGAGVIGNLVIRSIRALGIKCRIAVIEPSRFHSERALEAGADSLLDGENPYESAAETTGAKLYTPMIGAPVLTGGFDKIYDTVGTGATVTMALRIMAAHGVLSLLGISPVVKMDVLPLFLKQHTIKGSFAYGTAVYRGKKLPVFQIAIDLISSGKIQVDSMVTHRFSLDEYPEMIEVNLRKTVHRAVKTVVSFIDERPLS